MQAIITKYYGPTDTRGSRIGAKCNAGTISIPYPHELSGEACHLAAAQALADKLGWTSDAYGKLAGGTLPSGECCFVFVKSDAALRAAVSEVVPDLKQFVSRQGPGPDKRLAALLEVL